MANRFRTVDRETPYLFPPSVQEWLPETHLARFVVEVVSKLELRKLEDSYTKRGSEGYHPAVMLALLFYGYATGVFSSRKLEQATYDSVAFRYLAGNTHPDHDTIAHFRKRFLQELKPLFVEILLLAQAMGFLKLGRVSLDGTKVKANASKHSALSWGHIQKPGSAAARRSGRVDAAGRGSGWTRRKRKGWTSRPSWRGGKHG